MDSIYVMGTCDTKGAELRFVHDLIAAAGFPVKLVDVSTRANPGLTDHSAEDVAAFHPDGKIAVHGEPDRGKAITAMSEALRAFFSTRVDVAGVIALGGSSGTALVSPTLRDLAIGLPKILVSTVISGNVAPYVGASDIHLVYSVTDIAGLNIISRKILRNAAHALVGMVGHRTKEKIAEKPAAGLTMFGVTTPCVQQVTEKIAKKYDPLVFHATGTGGQSFEKLVDNGMIAVGIDITTTEVADMLIGGVFAASEDRFGAFIRTGTPWVGSCGALDMVNFGAMESVPERFRHRQLHVHNANVTLMRTTAEECERIGLWIGQRLNLCPGEVRMLLPEGGISELSRAGEPFHDPCADAALFAALERTIRVTPSRRIERLPFHINAPEFAAAIVNIVDQVTSQS